MTATHAALPRPTVIQVNADLIPSELKKKHQWVVWRLELRRDKKKNSKWTKIPFRVNGGTASSTDPQTWADFETVLTTYQRLFPWRDRPNSKIGFDGIGFVFAGDFVGVDLDHCVAGGVMESWASEIVGKLNSYAELSPSGTGVKLFCQGGIPTNKTGGRKGSIEVYSSGRYFTVTGAHWAGTPLDIRSSNGELSALWKVVSADATKPKARKTSPGASSYSPSDDDVIAHASKADNGDKFRRLMDGDTAGYPSASEADMALAMLLAFWTQDALQIERLMLQSKLTRDKWNTLRGSNTWIQETITAAIGKNSDFYNWNRAAGVDQNSFGFALTDTGLGERFAAQHGYRVKYIYPWSKWLYYDGQRWNPDCLGRIEQAAKETIRAIYEEAAGETDDASREALADFARRSESATKRAAMIQLARSEPDIPVDPNAFDKDPFALNCSNGTVDLRTGTLHPHVPMDMFSKLCPVSFDPEATCSTWLSCLDRYFNCNAPLINFIKRLIGYFLTGSVEEQILVILHGGGQNGKSTLIEVVLKMLGPDYGMKAASDFLMVKKGDSHPTDKTDLFGKRLVACMETEDGRRLSESLVKELTGGDAIRARRMREDFWQFDPTHKIILATNHRPVVRGTDLAIWRRLRLIPFDVAIPPAERDKKLVGKLLFELPGILAWAVQGCLDWQRSGLSEPPEIVLATNTYRKEQDMVGDFLTQCCVLEEDSFDRFSRIIAAYKDYSGDKNITSRRLGTALLERGYDRYTNNGTFYRGIRVLSSPVEKKEEQAEEKEEQASKDEKSF
jgi:putative DNA primase/helicase